MKGKHLGSAVLCDGWQAGGSLEWHPCILKSRQVAQADSSRTRAWSHTCQALPVRGNGQTYTRALMAPYRTDTRSTPITVSMGGSLSLDQAQAVAALHGF